MANGNNGNNGKVYNNGQRDGLTIGAVQGSNNSKNGVTEEYIDENGRKVKVTKKSSNSGQVYVGNNTYSDIGTNNVVNEGYEDDWDDDDDDDDEEEQYENVYEVEGKDIKGQGNNLRGVTISGISGNNTNNNGNQVVSGTNISGLGSHNSYVSKGVDKAPKANNQSKLKKQIEQSLKTAKEKLEKLNQELNGLSFFAFGKRKKLKNDIKDVERSISIYESKLRVMK